MKINSDKELDDLFQNKLAEEEMVPSGKLWNKIETELDKDKRRPAYYWWLGIGAALLVLLSGSYFLLRNNSAEISDKKNISSLDRTVESRQTDNRQNNSIDKIPATPSIENTNTKNDGSANSLQPENKNAEKKDNSISSLPKNDDSKHHTSVSSHTQRVEMKDNAVYPEKKDGSTSSPQVNGKQPAADKKDSKNKIENKQPVNSTQVNSKQSAAGNKEENATDNKKNNLAAKDANLPLDKKTGMLPSAIPDSIRKTEIPVIVSDPKKDSTVDSAKTMVKKTDSTKTIAVNLPPTIRPDSSPVQKDKARRFYIAAFYSPDQNNTFYTKSANKEFRNTSDLSIASENISPASSIGIKFGWMCSKWFSVGSGVHFSSFAEQSDELIIKYYRFTPYTFTLQTNMGRYTFDSHSFNMYDNSQPTYITGDTMRLAFTTKEDLSYISIPMAARFHFLNSRYFTLYGSAGLNEDILKSSSQQLIVERSGKVLDIQYAQGHSNYSTSVFVSFGAELHIYKGLGIWCEPAYRRKAGKMGIENRSPTNNKSFQIPIGVIYRF